MNDEDSTLYRGTPPLSKEIATTVASDGLPNEVRRI